MIKNLAFVLSLFLFLSSCYTIHFKRTAKLEVSYQVKKWHHIGLLGLMEFSSPVDLKSICPEKGWSSVRTQKGILQGLVGNLAIPTGATQTIPDTDITYPVTFSLGAFYSPEEVTVSCK